MSKNLFHLKRRYFASALLFFSMHSISAQQLIKDTDAEQAASAKQAVTNLDEVGGQVLTLYTHPVLPQKLWAGTSHGGLWQSDDAGHSWVLASDLIRNQAVAALAADPLNPEVMYAGTGSGRKRDVTPRGSGIYKTIDGGKSWSPLPLTNPATVGENWSHINSIAVSRAGVVLAATSDNKSNGFIYRSVDGGQTWGLLPAYSGSIIGPRNMIHKVRFDPDNPGTAIFMDDYANVTVSNDAGASWRVAKKSTTCP